MKISSSWYPVKHAAVLLFAAFAICPASAVLQAQTSNGSSIGTASKPAGGMVRAGSARSANAYKYFTYPNFELWDSANWGGNKVKAAPVAAWITSHQKDTRAEYVVKDKYKGIQDFVGHPDYTWKTENITDPDVTDPLTRMGLRTDIREGGGFYIFVAPEKVLADKTHRVPVLFVPYVLDKKDVFWAMNTLVHFQKYNELCAQRGDFIILYLLVEKSAAGRGGGLDSTLVDTAYDAYRGDYKRLYLDMSVFAENGAKVADLPGLDWSDDDGTKRDPDAAIEHLGFIPVLNVAGKWARKPSGGGIARARGDGLIFDPQRVVHGMLGEHWMEGISFLHNHGKGDDPAIKAHFDQMGLVFSQHDYQGERWIIFSPRQAVEEGKKLPLVLILSEVNYYNEYGISTAYSQYLDYFKLAAAGELNILLFARETPEAMDHAYDIIKEAEKTFPIEPSRIYVTGHSHNGHLTRDFAYRHPDMVAAAAPLGNSSGLASLAYSHEAVVADDKRIEAWSQIDMPIITIGAASEVTSPHTMPSSILNDYNLFIDAWQRRLTASRCPMKTREEIMAAERSDDYVTRLYGLPNDGSWLQVIDGVEHYIIDIKNVEGRKHLRIVGIENMVHTTEPTMPMLGWTFMRRFARDQQTGKVIELY
jgi:hypothetical protein